jgi:hypothetical protein
MEGCVAWMGLTVAVLSLRLSNSLLRSRLIRHRPSPSLSLQAETLFKLLLKYRPEDKTEKRERLKAEAEARAAGKEVRGAEWSRVQAGEEGGRR